jgi:Domain of unknown function (DUF4383)
MAESSPARLYCLLVGGVVLVVGIIGFFYEASFAVGDEVIGEELFDTNTIVVNGWANLIHITIGGLGLLAANSFARTYALGIGAVYVVLAILGFIAVESSDGIAFIAENGVLIDLVPVDNQENVLHAVLGALGLLAGFATKSEAPAAAAPAT